MVKIIIILQITRRNLHVLIINTCKFRQVCNLSVQNLYNIYLYITKLQTCLTRPVLINQCVTIITTIIFQIIDRIILRFSLILHNALMDRKKKKKSKIIVNRTRCFLYCLCYFLLVSTYLLWILQTYKYFTNQIKNIKSLLLLFISIHSCSRQVLYYYYNILIIM